MFQTTLLKVQVNVFKKKTKCVKIMHDNLTPVLVCNVTPYLKKSGSEHGSEVHFVGNKSLKFDYSTGVLIHCNYFLKCFNQYILL